VPEVTSADGTPLHVEVEGAGEPVTVFAHGLTNSCMELAAFTPMAPGTKVRFCFRGHAHSGTPPEGHYRFADFADDLDAVATEYGATRAVGTSLGQGAITHLLGSDPDRFERIVFVLPAALDLSLADHARFDHVAELLETLPVDEAIERIVADSKRVAEYDEKPWLRELDLFLWQDLNAVGVARAIREITRDVAIADRELLRRVTAPTLILSQEGDQIHPVELGYLLADLMPNAELVVLGSEDELLERLPELVTLVAAFLAEPV
jgi:pimeloyl-ACP methyl ester carboxylesterase